MTAFMAFARRPVSRIEERLIGVLMLGLLMLTAVSFSLRNRATVADGGAGWMHGEWLINMAEGPVRRGPLGSAILTVSDWTGLSPLVFVEMVQTGALFALVGALVVALIRLGLPVRLSVLTMSPAFVLMWHNEFHTHGKEILALLPFCPLLLAPVAGRGHQVALTLSVIAYAVAGLAHEAAILVAPFLMVAALGMAAPEWRRGIGYVLAIGVVGCALVAFTVTFTRVESVAGICQAVTDRGLRAELCEIYPWLAYSVGDAAAFTTERMVGYRWWPGVIAAIVLAYLPLVLLTRDLPKAGWILLGVLAGVLVFLPLYFVAVDYGRWLNMQIACITLTLILLLRAGHLTGLRQPMSRLVIWPLVGLALIWRVSPVTGGIGAGVLEPVVKAVLAAV